MNRSELFQKYSRPDPVPRVAEIAALVLAKSVEVEPISVDDAAQYADGVATPKPETMPPAHAAAVAKMLVDRAEALHRLAETDCNFGLTEAQEKRQAKIAAEVIEIAEVVGFRAETGGDPRGAVVRLYDPADERSGDGWGGGWPVYR